MTAPDPYRYFRIEARELLDQLGAAILELERGPSPEVMARTLRLAHTLKGAARVVKQTAIADRAHALEDAIAPARGSSAPLGKEQVDAVLALVDQMNAGVAALGQPPRPTDAAPASQAGQRSRANGATAPPPPRAEEPRPIQAESSELDELLESAGELHAHLAPLRKAIDQVDRAQRLAELVGHQLASGAGQDAGRAGAKARSTAEELRGLLATLERGLSSGVDVVEREMAQVRRTAERLRLRPAAAMFTSLERAARDAAQTLGKSVVFEGRGGDVRLDAQILSGVQGALVQVVRNAVAHGIEAPAERAAAGKPAAGRLTVEVARRGQRVAFVARDDGRGVDLEAVRRVVQRRGLLPDGGRTLDRPSLLRLLLVGGVSTARLGDGGIGARRGARRRPRGGRASRRRGPHGDGRRRGDDGRAARADVGRVAARPVRRGGRRPRGHPARRGRAHDARARGRRGPYAGGRVGRRGR